MKGAYIVTEGDLTLREITPETVREAEIKLKHRSKGAADLALLTEIIKPEPYNPVVSDPNPRRALPRRGVER